MIVRYPTTAEVATPVFFSVLIILLSFAPVFALTGQEGKLVVRDIVELLAESMELI